MNSDRNPEFLAAKRSVAELTNAEAISYRPPTLTDADRAAAFPVLHSHHEHADLAEAAGGTANESGWVVGLRFWF